MSDFEVSKSFNKDADMTKEDMLVYLDYLNEELKSESTKGKVALVGGAVMCLVLNTRQSTRDIDAIFEPKALIYDCIKKVADKHGLSDNWLNDGVKGFISPAADFRPHLELSNLEVFAATPEYMLAMKCLSSRADSESEMDDIRSLLKLLGLSTYEEVETIMVKYYPLERFQIKTQYVIQEVLDDLQS